MEQLDVSKINKLILLIAKNSNWALGTLFEYTYKNMKVVANYYLINKSDTEDVLSQLYQNVITYAKTFDNTKNGYNWMFTIVKNLAWQENSRYKEKRNLVVCEEIADQKVDPINKLFFEEAFSVLTEKEKQLLYKCFWEGYTISELANKYHVPKTTIYHMRDRIYKKIRPYLIDDKQDK